MTKLHTPLFLLVLHCAFGALAQTRDIDSLKQSLQTEQPDSTRALSLSRLAGLYVFSRPDTSMIIGQQGLALSRKTGYTRGEAVSLNAIAAAFLNTGNYAKALEASLQALKKAEATHRKPTILTILGTVAIVYAGQGDKRRSIEYTLKALNIARSIANQNGIEVNLLNLGDNYEKLNMLDSAKAYTVQAYSMALQLNDTSITGVALNNLGNVYSKMGESSTAMANYRQGIPFLIQFGQTDALCETYLGVAKLFQKTSNTDSSVYYAKQSLELARSAGFTSRVLDASNFLTRYYTAIHNVDSAFAYQSVTIAAKDSLFNQQKQREFQSLSYEETVRQQQLEEARKEARTQLKFNALWGGLGTLLLVAFLLFRNNRQKQKAFSLIQRQKKETENAYEQLKSTQKQLIQSEKMASLGELTAGIAHEIQNPLNFVNNFAEANVELLEEATEELKAGNQQETLTILSGVKENELKIRHHGNRADSIVKGMLEHSRTSKGEKQLTNINALADEYLRLAYHGLRAKDKAFNSHLETSFDEHLGNVNIVSQDMGRVFLNLFNNAFYAVDEKKQRLNGSFEPRVRVVTQKENGTIVLRVADNGNGIPQRVLDKIFQPFFTTKPAGQGTGLGLSLSYDIIKAHGGEIKAESKEGEGTTFIITLPA